MCIFATTYMHMDIRVEFMKWCSISESITIQKERDMTRQKVTYVDGIMRLNSVYAVKEAEKNERMKKKKKAEHDCF